MDNPVEEVKNRLDIVEYIGQYVNLRRAGRNFNACCPFHKEHTPSFVVSPERQIWRCFGACNEGGDIIAFVMKWENISFSEALAELAHKAGVTIDKQVNTDSKQANKKEKIQEINKLTQSFYHHVLLNTPFGEAGKQYLEKRGINNEIIKTFGIGVAPNSWDSLIKFLKKKKYSEQEILDAGLVIKSEKGTVYDRFRSRIVFPLYDHRGNILAFSGRLVGTEESSREGKYINNPETVLYHKRATLYGINLAKDYIRKEDQAILVEGEFDVISPYMHGIKNIVAIKGSAVTTEQLQILKRFTSKVCLALDSDSAGQEAILRGIQEAEKLNMEISIMVMDGGKDPDEMARKDIYKFKQLIKSGITIYDYIINSAQKKYRSEDPFGKKKIGEMVVPYLTKVYNPIVQGHYIRKLAGLIDVSEDSISHMINIERYKNKRRAFHVRPKDEEGKTKSDQKLKQRYFLSTVFQSKDFSIACDTVKKVLTASDFSFPAYGKVFQMLLQYKDKYTPQEFNVNEFIKIIPKEMHPVVDEIYLSIADLPPLSDQVFLKELEKLALRVKIQSLNDKIKNIDLSDQEEEKKDLKKIELIKERKELEKMINRL